ncbi:hypothetical protein [Bradyrhizobium sp. McL0615]|uniref:hypothetical protein n=1 Tax=Bradyrhizobium sp. McL0615 TaxID=3415673 RepID=UPI003CFB662D
MSADKLQAVHEAIADIFNEPNLNAVGTENLTATFYQETISEAFSKSRPNAANTKNSFAQFDHAALTGIFNDALPTSPTERLSPTSFDQAFAEILSERPSLSSNAQSSRAHFGQQAHSEMLSKPPVSTHTRPPQPSFDHQALAEILTESRADPIDPQMSRPSYDANSLSEPFLGRTDHGEPQANPSTVASSTNAESEWSRRARSLLARVHHIFTTKEESLLSDNERKSLHPPLAGQADPPEPIAIAVSTPAAKPTPATSPLVEPSHFSVEQEPRSPHLSGHSGHERPIVDGVVVTASTDAPSTLPQQATSWPDERSSPISANTESSSPTVERQPSTSTVASWQNNVEQTARPVAVATSTEADGELLQQARSLLIETVSTRLDNVEPPVPLTQRGQSTQIASDQLAPANVEHAQCDVEKVLPLSGLLSLRTTAPHVMKTEPSQLVLSGHPHDLTPAEETVPDVKSGQSQPQVSLSAERASLISTNSESPPLNVHPELSPPTLSDRVKNMASAASTVAPARLTNAESARPQRLRSEPTLASSENEPFPPASPTQSKNLEPAIKTTSVVPRTNSENASETERMLDEILSSASSRTKSRFFSFGNEISPVPLSDELDGAGPAIEPTAATLPVHVTTQQTNSLPLADRPALVSTDTNYSWSIHGHNSPHSTPSGQLHSLGPSGKPPEAAPSEVEGGLPQHVSPLLAALRVPNTKPSPPLLEKTPSRLVFASQPDNAGIAGETIAHLSDAESMLAQPPRSLKPEMSALVSTDTKSSASIFKGARPASDQAANEMPAVQPTLVASSANTGSAVTRARQAKSLLDQLDLNTAIQLRWTMRDIRSKRTKFSPVSAEDLTALLNLGLVEMRDGLPRLTAAGVIALD